jgi:Fe-S oxidoreductase
VFRDEMLNLIPEESQAQRLSHHTFLLSEFLSKYAPNFSPPKFNGQPKALLHGHCHQKALMGAESELEWLKKAGVEAELLDSGCCGMAGSFGFERDKYEVSRKCGEHALLPKVRGASPETLIVASGFSCQEQIAQLTDRRALHLAHVLQMAVRQTQEHRTLARYPECMIFEHRQQAVRQSMMKAGAGLGGVIAAASAAVWLTRGRTNNLHRAA